MDTISDQEVSVDSVGERSRPAPVKDVGYDRGLSTLFRLAYLFGGPQGMAQSVEKDWVASISFDCPLHDLDPADI